MKRLLILLFLSHFSLSLSMEEKEIQPQPSFLSRLMNFWQTWQASRNKAMEQKDYNESFFIPDNDYEYDRRQVQTIPGSKPVQIRKKVVSERPVKRVFIDPWGRKHEEEDTAYVSFRDEFTERRGPDKSWDARSVTSVRKAPARFSEGESLEELKRRRAQLERSFKQASLSSSGSEDDVDETSLEYAKKKMSPRAISTFSQEDVRQGLV